LRSQYNVIIQRKFLLLFELDLREFGIKYNTFITVLWLHLVNDIDLCLSPKSPKKPIKPLFWRSRSSKVIEFGANREPVYDFPLVINSNQGLISHRY